MTNQSYTPSTSGLRSYIDASPEYELAPIGIASMQDQAQKLAEFGRNGDIYVIHAAQGETVIPMEVLEANPQIKALLFNQMAEMGLDPQRYVVGDQLNSLNPVTGMPEFFFSSIFKGIKKAVKSVAKTVKEIAPVALPIILSFTGFPAFLGLGAGFAAGTVGAAALSAGIGSLIGGGSLKEAFKSALWAGGTAGIFGAFKGAWSAPGGITGPNAWAGAKAGLGRAWTGTSNVFDAAGNLIGTQKAPTWDQRWGALKEGDYSGAISGKGTFEPTEAFAATREGAPYAMDWSQVTSPEFAPLGEIPPSAGYIPGVTTSPVTTSPVTTSPVTTSSVPKWTGPGPDPSGSKVFGFGQSDVPVNVPTADISGGTAADALGGGIEGDWLTKTGDLFRRGGKPQAYWDALETKAYDAAIAKGHPIWKAEEIAKAAGPNVFQRWGPTVAAGGLGAWGLGAFDVAEGDTDEEIRKASEAALAGRRTPIDPELVLASQIATTTPGVEDGVYIPSGDVLQPTIFNEAGEYIGARGGSVNYPERDLLVEGPGTEKSDDIPAMLSDGEFVINSKAVRGADPSGRGNRYAGAQNLYNLMRNFEMRA